MKRTVIIILLFLPIISYNQNLFKILYDSLYFNAYSYLTENKDTFLNSDQRLSYYETISTFYSFVGQYQKAEKYFDIRNKEIGDIPEKKLDLHLASLEINQDTLNKLYRSYNVVMFNECHHLPQHRAFLYSQLKILKSLGYNQLALESLEITDDSLYIRKCPIKINGFYINEPVMNNLIRLAIELDFKLISYDEYCSNREYIQAKNLFDKYNQKEGKLIVLGGYGHISESNNMMGQYFKEMINEDILSISQFNYYHINPIYPENFKNKLFLYPDQYKQFDYILYYKIEKSIDNIPNWYEWMNFEKIDLSTFFNFHISEPTLIQIFKEESSIPIYQYLLEENQKIKIVIPEKGEYILKIINNKQAIQTFKIKIK
jgi:hypothetical protein